MPSRLMKIALAALALVCGATGGQAASVKSASLALASTGGITVIAEDGHTYSKLVSHDLNFSGSVHVSMKRGRVYKFAIYNGACAALCLNGIGYESLFQKFAEGVVAPLFGVKHVHEDVSFSVSAGDYPTGLTQNLEAHNIFQACYAHQGHSVIKSDVTFIHLMTVTLALQFLRAKNVFTPENGAEPHPDLNYEDWWQAFTVPVRVTCKALEQPHMPGGMAQDMGDFKVTGIDLFLSTFSNATTQPNPATTCKKGRVLVRVETSKAGPVKFKLWTRVGHSPMTSKVVDASSSFDGNSKYVAEHTEWVSVDHPTQVQAMAEDVVNSVGLQTQWKDIMLPCSGPGGGNKGGGLTAGHDEPVLPDLKLTGDFSYVDVGAPKCARTGKALISFTSNRADTIYYALDCTNGQHFSGSVKPKQVPQKGLVGVATQTFQIDKTTVYSCALKTLKPVAKLQKWKSHTFKCVEPSGEASSGDLAPETRPEEPPVVNTLTGDFSFVDSGGTHCPRTGKALINFKTNTADNVHYSLDCTNGHFSGVAQTTPDPKGGFVAPALVSFDIKKTTQASCALKTVAPGKPKMLKLKGHTFKCVKPSGVSGSGHLKPEARPEQNKPEKPAIATPIGCVNGKVKHGACVCPRGHKRTVIGKNAWRCVKTAVIVPPKPPVGCVNGTVKNGACICPRGHKRTVIGKNAWRCVKTAVVVPPKLPVGCVNGRVRNGRCVCPRSYKPVKAGKNAWRCVKVHAPAQLAPRRSTR